MKADEMIRLQGLLGKAKVYVDYVGSEVGDGLPEVNGVRFIDDTQRDAFAFMLDDVSKILDSAIDAMRPK